MIVEIVYQCYKQFLGGTFLLCSLDILCVPLKSKFSERFCFYFSGMKIAVFFIHLMLYIFFNAAICAFCGVVHSARKQSDIL